MERDDDSNNFLSNNNNDSLHYQTGTINDDFAADDWLGFENSQINWATWDAQQRQQQQRQQQQYDEEEEEEERNEEEEEEEEEDDTDTDQDQYEDGSALAPDLVDLMGEDVFLVLLQSLVAQGRATDATALCSSSQRARDLCRTARVNWERNLPEIAAAYGGDIGAVPASAAIAGLTQPSVLQTALAMRRHRDVSAADERFCILYALYAQAVARRVAYERQQAHALDVQSGAALQTARNVERARAEIQAAAASRSSRSPGRLIGRALRGMVPSRGLRMSGLGSRVPLERHVEPHPDVADVLESPDEMSLQDLLEWARSRTDVSGYAPGAAEGDMAPWYVAQLGDEPPVPYGDPRLRYFYITSMSPPMGAATSLGDRRLRGRDVLPLLRADIDRVVTGPDLVPLRQKAARLVNEALKTALTAPARERFAPAWARRRGVPRRSSSDDQDDPSLATLEALQRLAQRCASIDVFRAFAPVSTYLAVRPFGSTDLITYDIVVGLPLGQ